MSIRGISRRIDRLEGSPKRHLWIIDMAQFPDCSRQEAVRTVGNGFLPRSDDVVIFRDEDNPIDPQRIMDHGGLLLFGDPVGRTLGQVLIGAAAAAPQSRLSPHRGRA